MGSIPAARPEALVTVHRDGSLDPECSAAFVRWFGAPGTGHFAAQLARSDTRTATMLELAWGEMGKLVEQRPRPTPIPWSAGAPRTRSRATPRSTA